MLAKIRILDEVSVVVAGLEDDHFTYLYNTYGVFAPNYFFHPKFKLGVWDGKIRFFSKTGKTFLYLLDDLLPRVKNLGYKIELEDHRHEAIVKPDFIDDMIFNHIIQPQTKKPTVLKEHQVEAVNALIKQGYGIAVAATGGGKTLMCAALCHQYGGQGVKTLTIVPNRDLIGQTYEVYKHYGLDVGEYWSMKKTINHQHVVSTWQALRHAPEVVKLFEMVIVDECHKLRGNVLTKIVTEHAGKMPYRFGFTATLPKDKADAWAVHVAVGMVQYEIPAHELIEKGELAKPTIHIMQLEEDLREQWQEFLAEIKHLGVPDDPPKYEEFKDSYFPDFKSEKAYLERNTTRLEWIANLLEQKRDEKKGNVLCFVNSIPYGRKLLKMVKNAYFVNGKDMKDPRKRKQIYDMFDKNDDLLVIATVHIAGTGNDIPRIFNLVLVDVGKSFIRVIQGIGRGMRIAEDKDSVTIYDICSDLKNGKKHTKDRIKFYKDAQYPYKTKKIDYNKPVAFD